MTGQFNDVDLPTNILSLCAGGGGLDLGIKLAVPSARTVCYLENEITACGVLAANMETGRLDTAPIWTDLRTFDGEPWRGVVDLITGGYPCQPFSNAGKKLGADDPRHLWPDVLRIVREVRPRICFFENVGAHLRLGGHEVIRSLQELGYRTAATLLTAAEVGATHQRERLFIMAYAEGQLQREPDNEARPYARDQSRQNAGRGSLGMGEIVADAERGRVQFASPSGGHGAGTDAGRTGVSEGVDVGDAEGQRRREGRPEHGIRGGRDAITGAGSAVGGRVADAGSERSQGISGAGAATGPAGRGSGTGGYQWPPVPGDVAGWQRVLAERPDLAPALQAEPAIRGVADGVARGLGRGDQLHILGNGVVPDQAAYAFRLLAAELGIEAA